MKFLPVALATLVAFASAAKDCKDEASKVPTCAVSCVNTEAAKYCKGGDLACSCAPTTLAKIIKDSTDCVAKECKGQAVFPALKNFCECSLEGSKPTKTTTTPKPTSTLPCRAEEAKVPDCAQSCVNDEAAKICTPGDLKCACAANTLETIIKKSTACVEKACKGSGPVFPLLRDFCKCVNGDGHSSSSSAKPTHSSTKTSASSSATHTKTSTKTSSTAKSSSATSTKTSKSSSAASSHTSSMVTSVKPTSNTTTSNPVTYTSTFTTTKVHTITSCGPEVTSCPAGGETTETLTLTTTWCPEATTTSKPITYTSTFTTTKVHTITSCGPEVTSCPAGGKSTETLTLTSTWCPETESQALPTGTEGATGPGGPPYPTETGTELAPVPSNVPSGTPIVSQPPVMTAGAATQGNSIVFAGIIAAVAALA